MAPTNRRSTRPSLTVAAFACVAAVVLTLASTGHAATTIGQTDPAASPGSSCVGGSIWAQWATVASPEYAVPAAGGVVTSWSHNANSASGREVALEVLRLSGGSATAISASAVEIATAGTLNSFSTRIPVTAGDVLGLWIGNVPIGPGIGGGASCIYFAGGDEVRYGGAFTTPAGGGSPATLGNVVGDARVNVAAVVEPDLDGDGFGDETQDDCPSDAATQGACPQPLAATVDPPTAADDPAPAIAPPRLAVRVPAHVSLSALGSRRLKAILRSDVAAATVVKGAVRIGKRRIRIARTAVELTAGDDRKLRIRLRRKARRAALRALDAGRRVSLRIVVTAVGPAGGRTVVRRTLRLVP